MGFPLHSSRQSIIDLLTISQVSDRYNPTICKRDNHGSWSFDKIHVFLFSESTDKSWSSKITNMRVLIIQSASTFPANKSTIFQHHNILWERQSWELNLQRPKIILKFQFKKKNWHRKITIYYKIEAPNLFHNS